LINISEALDTKEIVLLGSGQLGEMTLDLWPEGLLRPVLVLDRSGIGTCRGIPTVDPLSHTPNTSKYLYVLCYFKESPDQITKTFEEWIGQEIVIAYDVLTGFAPQVFSNGWVPRRTKKQALAQLPVFSDKRSRDVYINAILWKYDRKLDLGFELSDEQSKYAIGRHFRSPRSYQDIFDFGSHNGSFFKGLHHEDVGWNRAIAFEPDPQIRRVLKDRLLSNASWGNVIVDDRAVWSQGGQVNFFAPGLLSSRVVGSGVMGTYSIRSTSLSEALASFYPPSEGPSLIKLHVEGAEFPAISFAINDGLDLKNFDMFINLSHDEESLFDLPQLIADEGNHDVFLETHSLFAEGLTLFARSRKWYQYEM